MNYRFSGTPDGKRHRFWSDVCQSYNKHFILSALLISAMILSFAGDIIAQGPPPGGPPGGQQSERDIRVIERDRDGKAKIISFFNVVNANIQDILKFMSDETNLTIIASEKVQGKVTIVNLKGVTVDEALDALKTSLLSLGFTMVRVNKTIVIVPVGEAKTRPLRVQIGSDPNMIDSTDEMITQIIPLSSADAAEMALNLKNLVPKDADVFADTTTNSLVITDTSANIRRLALIIKQLDTQPSGVLRTQIFQLKYANATTLAQTLNDLFRQGVETARAFQKLSGRSPDEMMKMLDMARREGRLPTKGIDAVRGQVLIAGDDRTNKLIVTASETNLEIIEKLIEELDSSRIAQAEIKVFLLSSGIAADVAQELQTLLQGSGGQNLPPWERWRARELQTTTKGIQGSVNIVSDERLNAVIVSSDPQNFPLIESIINQLDQEIAPQEVIKIIPLKYADSTAVVQNLQDLFQDQGGRDMPWWERERRRFERGRRGDSDQITGIQGQVNLVADTRLNAIVVSTAVANIPILEELINKMDITIPDLETDTKIFQLVNSDAESVAEILNNVYSQGNQRRGGGGFDFFFWMPRSSRSTSQRSGVLTGSISIEAYTRTNSLLVTTSSARNFDIIEKLIEQLDQPTPTDYRYSTFIYPLEYANAGDMQSLLTDVFSEEGGGGTSRGRGGQSSFFRMMMTGRSPVPRDTTTLFGQVRINSDSNTNSLIVTTPERNHEAVKDVIKQLDISRGQVWMEIKVLEVTLGEESNLGLEWNWKEGKHLGKDGLNAVFGTDFNAGDSTLGFTYKVFNKNLTATLNALMKENKVEVLSAPSVLTRDNQPTTLSRGKDIPYLQSTSTNQFGQVIYDYDFLQDIGINLSLTPHIAKYGTKSKALKEGEKRTIGLEITEINVSSFLEYTDFDAPVTSDSTITSYIDVEDGDQVAIGGMIKKESKKTIHKFPILGSIPFIGRLFNRTTDIIENTQLWVLITPHIIDINKPEDRETLKDLQEEQRKQVEMKMSAPEMNNGALKSSPK